MAPMPSSGWNGTPSLRTMITSSDASSARATSNAMGDTTPRQAQHHDRLPAQVWQQRGQAAARIPAISETHVTDPPAAGAAGAPCLWTDPVAGH